MHVLWPKKLRRGRTLRRLRGHDPGSRPADDADQPALDDDTGKTVSAPEALVSQVLEELQSAGKIAAIKLYREQTGMGLKDAKEAVEALGAKHGIIAARSGCAGVLLLAGGTLAAVP